MVERHDITLHEEPGDNPPDALDRIIREFGDAFNELRDPAIDGAKHWMSGKGRQQSARVAEIISQAQERLGNLALRNEELKQQRTVGEQQHRERMYELETLRAQQKMDAMAKMLEEYRKLIEMGVEVELEAVFRYVEASFAGQIGGEFDDGDDNAVDGLGTLPTGGG